MVELTLATLCKEAQTFAIAEGSHTEPTLYGVDNGKTIGTYLEQKFRLGLKARYSFSEGNSASGIDFPGLNVDIKTTSIRQPQSSCPFKDVSQKIYGLGYNLVVFVYDKSDDAKRRTATLRMTDVVYVAAECTGDYQTTRGLLEILDRDANADDIIAFLIDRHLPAEEVTLTALADRILSERPNQGYLTISNALQWRLQYSRVIAEAGRAEGVQVVYHA